MKDEKTIFRRLGDFLAGKGFYAVLFICTAVIGISAWILLSTGERPESAGLGGAPEMAVSADEEAMASAPADIGDALATEAAQGTAFPSAQPTDAGKASEKPSTASPTPASSPSPSKGGGKSTPAMASKLDFAWPLVGDIAVMYSGEELIYSKTMGDWRTHEGIDIAGALGAKVMAAADGTVVDVKSDDLLGTVVVIDHGAGLKSIYANLAKVPVVKKGDKVAMGAVIGSIGDTALGETSEASHLHFAMTKDDVPVDPLKYLPKK